MAWACSGTSNSELINNMAANGLINSERVKKAMLGVRAPSRILQSFHMLDFTFRHNLVWPCIYTDLSKVDRAHYAPSRAYEDSPQPIGHSATISAPHMHASACESLLPFLNAGAKVLDIGSGSGYLTHVLAELVQPGGTVIGIDHIQPLVDMAKKNMAKSAEGRGLLESGAVEFIKADGRLGWKEGAPYDAIHVGAAAAEHHQSLVDQLKAPGR